MASTGTVWANLAYLIGAVVLAVIGGVGVWLRHRQPKSVEGNMASFQRGLSVLAPHRRPGNGADSPRVTPLPGGLTHVRIERSEPAPAGGDGEADGNLAGGDPG